MSKSEPVRWRLRSSFGWTEVADSVPPDAAAVYVSGLERLATDHRYYDLVKESLGAQFEHLYLILRDGEERARVVQPFLLVRQDLVTGTPPAVRCFVEAVRRRLPGFLKLPMLMIGCSAGEGDLALDGGTGAPDWTARALGEVLPRVAKRLHATLAVFKDFPLSYRETLQPLQAAGFTRVPSMPATRLRLDFADFEDYLQKKLSHSMRKNLRRKFRKSESGPPITVEAVTDITPFLEEVYPLYHAVFARSKLQFEELNKDYLRLLSERMADRARFLLWRQEGKIIAFASFLVHDGVLKDNYIGLDYSVALDYHLYYVTWRDTIEWALRNRCHTYHSAPLNYDPKLHFRMELEPLDLYARATAAWVNVFFRRLLPWLEPTRADPAIRKFANAADLW